MSSDERNDSSTLLVCFSHLRWDFVWQRPQHLLIRAAQKYRVLFVEEPVFRGDESPRMDLSTRPGGVTIALPILPKRFGPLGLEADEVVDVQRRLVEKLLYGERHAERIFWYYTPMALAFTSHLDCDACVYDNMDELSAFKFASPRLLGLEDDLFARADVVFTGGISLFEAKRHRHHNIHAFPSSIDTAHFHKARERGAADPSDQATLARPRLGFFGVIDERMDIALVGDIAAMRPDWQFVMIGPVVKIDPATLPQRPNLHWIGGKSYAELPNYLAHWDVGLMPFALNEATRFISPTKTPEFLAAGLPVVSTPITDVVRPYGDKGLVAIGATAAEIVDHAGRLLSMTDDERQRSRRRVDRHLSRGSWEQTYAAMNGHLREVLGPTPRREGSGAPLPAMALSAPSAD
jgi:glycosyltransferase involved in cell wall biosynthesis